MNEDSSNAATCGGAELMSAFRPSGWSFYALAARSRQIHPDSDRDRLGPSWRGRAARELPFPLSFNQVLNSIADHAVPSV